jgi:hypothetical protein
LLAVSSKVCLIFISASGKPAKEYIATQGVP